MAAAGEHQHDQAGVHHARAEQHFPVSPACRSDPVPVTIATSARVMTSATRQAISTRGRRAPRPSAATPQPTAAATAGVKASR